MIRKLTAEDNEKVMALVTPKASINLFIIGDIEMYGYEEDFQEIWGDFENDNLRGILLRYYNDFVIYGEKGYDAKGFVEIIEGFENHDCLNGELEVLQFVKPYLKNKYKVKELYFAECTKDTLKLSENKELIEKVKCAKPEDTKILAELMCSIEEFTVRDTEEETERMAKKIRDKAGRVYFIEDAENTEKVLSMSASTAENSKSAMIVGVCTHKEHRNKGYTTAIMSSMLEDLFKEKETVCLFYDNPKAGTIYKRSGFYDIGMYTMLNKEK